jgi:Rad3-related DNA helicase
MNYEKQILEAYEFLGFQPRGRQVEDIDKILVAFLDEGFTTVTLSAPTGTGKSIIGAVTAEVLHKMESADQFAGASFLLSPTNILSEQYFKTFQEGRDPLDTRFRMIKGAANFNCAALTTAEEVQTAEMCAIRLFQKSGEQSMIDTFCNGCDFALQKRLRDRSRHLITNYAYYFIDRMYTQIMAKRTVCVFDEAHLINDLFTDHNAIYVSDSRLKKMSDEIMGNLSISDVNIFKTIKEVAGVLKAGQVNRGNYKEILLQLAEVYSVVTELAQEAADASVRDPKRYLLMSKMSKKYFGLGCKIADLFEYDYPHAFDFQPLNPKVAQSENEMSVKPIFVGDMFEVLINAKYNLLMSATIGDIYAKKTMTLPNAKHIRLAPTFPIENKKVIFFKPQALSRDSLQLNQVMSNLKSNCKEIVNHHTEKNERGIILTPSFVLSQTISDYLANSNVKAKIFEHHRGDKLSLALQRFKEYTGGPAVMITASGFEGMDLPGDLSRYQILVKSPFASLGEARVKIILDTYPDLYKLMCLMKIVQGAGRSVRSPTDYATTYILDSNAQRLWTDRINEWKDEFLTSFTSILE